MVKTETETEIDLSPMVTGIFLQRGTKRDDSYSRKEQYPTVTKYFCSGKRCSWGKTNTEPFFKALGSFHKHVQGNHTIEHVFMQRQTVK